MPKSHFTNEHGIFTIGDQVDTEYGNGELVEIRRKLAVVNIYRYRIIQGDRFFAGTTPKTVRMEDITKPGKFEEMFSKRPLPPGKVRKSDIQKELKRWKRGDRVMLRGKPEEGVFYVQKIQRNRVYLSKDADLKEAHTRAVFLSPVS